MSSLIDVNKNYQGRQHCVWVRIGWTLSFTIKTVHIPVHEYVLFLSFIITYVEVNVVDRVQCRVLVKKMCMQDLKLHISLWVQDLRNFTLYIKYELLFDTISAVNNFLLTLKPVSRSITSTGNSIKSHIVTR